MSTYETVAKIDGKFVRVMMLDDYFGPHNYGCQLPGGEVVHADAVQIASPFELLDEIERLKIRRRAMTDRAEVIEAPVSALAKVLGAMNRVMQETNDSADDDILKAVAGVLTAAGFTLAGPDEVVVPIEAGAKFICETAMRYEWASLTPKTGSCVDDGYPAWKVGGIANARQEDFRQLVRDMGALQAAQSEGDSDDPAD